VKRPTKGAIAKRLVDIARKEGLEIETNAAEMLVEQVGNDIRQVLHAMQMWRARSCSLRYGDLRDGGMARIEKDKILRQSPFEACQMLLAGPSKGTPLEDRYNVYFVDYSLVPLLVQQNYIEASKNGVFKSPRLSDCDKMDALARAADAVSDMELAGASIMGADQHWELLPTTAAFACRVGTMIDGFMGFPTFPQWLGKNSSRGKFKRFTQELVLHSSLAAGQGFAAVRLEYVPYWRRLLVQPLVARGSEGAEAVIALLDAYGLSKDDFMETMREMQFLVEKDAVLADAYAGIDAQVRNQQQLWCLWLTRAARAASDWEKDHGS
jgi:replication factor C subunit 1